MSGRKLLLVVTGSIAAYKVATVVSRLVQEGWQVQVVATEAALRLVGEATWEGLSGRPVASETFARGHLMDHLRLVREADLVLVAPATADYLARCAAGLGNDLAAALFLAHDFTKPWLVAPAMNVAMWNHPATRANVARLRDMGVTVIEPESGALACRETGGGRLPEPETLLEVVRATAATLPRTPAPPAPWRGRVVVTAGGTQEPVDAVRVLTNLSTGRTGVALAEHLAAAGFAVHLLRARGVTPAGAAVTQQTEFTSVASLAQALQAALAGGAAQAVVHAAAVGDYTVSEVRGADGAVRAGVGKIGSEGALTIGLKAAPKLVDHLRAWAGDTKLMVVAFKLTATPVAAERRAAVEALLTRAKPDWVMHNDALEKAEGRHTFTAMNEKGAAVPLADVGALGDFLVQTLAATEAKA